MSMTDPRVLIPMLEDLQQGLERAVAECRDCIANAARWQRHLAGHGARLAARIGALEALAHEDKQCSRETLAAVEAAEARSTDAVGQSDQILDHARRVLAMADFT